MILNISYNTISRVCYTACYSLPNVNHEKVTIIKVCRLGFWDFDEAAVKEMYV